MTLAPNEVLPDEQSLEAAPPPGAVQGRSLRQIAWSRIRRDKVAMISLVVIVVLVLVALFAPLLTRLNGYPPDQFNTAEPGLLNRRLGGLPLGSFGGVSGQHWFGVEPATGRDIFSRIVHGARVSLSIALLATLVSVVLGTVLGLLAGYFGGWVDNVISRVMDVLLAFPQLLFIIALTPVIDDRLTALGLPNDNRTRVIVLVFIIGFFGWPYLARIVRGQTLSLREREFVEASKSLGAGSMHIVFKQLLPNLAATILVYASLIIPTNITTEAALSFLGVGVREPTASWGNMLAVALRWYQVDPMFMVFPGAALFVTVLAFNLLGDTIRDALDPRAGRS
ncbi:MAG: ABC transporter permease [Actinomycetota bacterium]|nr:ABC transporter permease [Actinomycetota bacterium]